MEFFNAASITVRDSEPGISFEEVLELYIIYISEFDFLKGGKTIYHVEKILRGTSEVIDDGLHEIFVNTVIDDGTDIAELMSCFTKKEVQNVKFPVLSSEVRRLKETEGGVQVVCEVMQRYEKIAVNGIIELSDFPDSQWFFSDLHRQYNGSYFDIMSSPTEVFDMSMEYDEDVSRFLCEPNDNSSWFYVFPATDIYNAVDVANELTDYYSFEVSD